MCGVPPYQLTFFQIEKCVGHKPADEYRLNFLDEVPLGIEVREHGDSDVPVVVPFSDSTRSAEGLHMSLVRANEAGTRNHVAGQIV